MSSLKHYLTYWLAALVGLTGLSSQALADSGYPSKPIRLIIPFQGGITEQLGRTYAVELEKNLGRPVIVEVKPGAGGSLGARYAARAANDGYTLVIGSNALTIQQAMTLDEDFDPTRNLDALAPIMSQPFLLYVQSDSDIKTLADYLAYAKANPGKLTYGSVGPNTSAHLIGALLAIESGVKMTHVSYRGGGAQALAVMSGEAVSGYLTSAFLKPYTEAGTLRPLVIVDRQRSPVYPAVPTITELGYPALADIGSSWFALYAPKGLPANVHARLVQATEKIHEEGVISKLILSWGGVPLSGGPDYLDKLQASSLELYKKLFQRLQREGK